jgi:Kef-type K+ transport system membrane component KefB
MGFSRNAIRRVSTSVTVFAAIACTVLVALAQQPTPNETPGNANVPRGGLDLVTSRTLLLTLSLLVFGVFIIFLEYLLLRKRLGDKIDDLGKFFILTLIIIGTLVLVGAGISAEQIAPVIGLFGTVAGYLLGRSSHPGTLPEADSSDAAPQPNSIKPPPKPAPDHAPPAIVNPPPQI